MIADAVSPSNTLDQLGLDPSTFPQFDCIIEFVRIKWSKYMRGECMRARYAIEGLFGCY